MGSPLSKNETCMAWCGDEGDAYPDPPVLSDECREGLVFSGNRLPTLSTHHEDLRPAPSTNETLRSAGRVISRDAPLSECDLRSEEKEIPGDGMEGRTNEGLQSFFHPDGDELVEDISWSRKKRGPTLAELLRRVEYLGNVDLALSEIRGRQRQEDRGEAMTRTTVLERFLLVMGPEGPGLAVKKCHRSSHFGTGGAERGKWAARIIRFELSVFEGQPGGTPLGGIITWNSKRLFPREQQGINIADITKVEHNGKCVWMTPAEGVGRLGFETSSNLNARFLCRSIDFLISATVQHDHIGGAGRHGSKTSSVRSGGIDNDVYETLALDGLPPGV